MSLREHRKPLRSTKSGVTRPGNTWDKSRVFRLVTNPKYLGQVPHKGQTFPGEQEALIDRRTWDAVQAIIARNSRVRGGHTRAETPAMLKGLLRCGHCGTSMGISFVKGRHNSETRYRYYVCTHAAKSGYETCTVKSVPAGTAEAAVVDRLRAIFRSPEMIARTYRAAVAKAGDDVAMQECIPTENDVRAALMNIDPVWEVLFPREQERIVKLLVEKVVMNPDSLDVIIRTSGLSSLVAELQETVEGAQERVSA